VPLLSKYLQRCRVRKVVRWVRGSVLDLGCGDASLLPLLAGRMERYCGVERSAELVESLGRRYPGHRFLCLDMDEDRIDTEERFDTVLMVAFIEHVYNQKRLFTEVLRHLRPDGRIVITTPTPLGDRIHCWGTSLSLFAQAAKDDHPIIFNKQRFRVFAKHFGLEIEAYRRFQLGCNQLVVLRRRGS
jgi:SAM-dependent methyltransferase